jgi:glycosyltransferase involved in cell wall biosynthesis
MATVDAAARSTQSCVALFAERFQQAHGRPPRVLHIGNIANNAYNNAKFLNRSGFDCDVICYDYYHVMACPEWEDADYTGEILDPLAPDWRAVDLHGFQRPRWFAQGPLLLCHKYLLARRRGNEALARSTWWQLAEASKYPSDEPRPRRTKKLTRTTRRVVARALSTSRAYGARHARAAWYWWRLRTSSLRHRVVYIARRDRSIYAAARPHLRRLAARTGRLEGPSLVGLTALTFIGVFTIRLVLRPFLKFGARTDVQREPGREREGGDSIHRDAAAGLIERMQDQFAAAFPARSDQLSRADITPYLSVLASWRELFRHYDFVCAYSTDAILPLLTNHRTYIAYEHGTIRDIPWEHSGTGRLCALAYASADVVYITNADSIVHARSLGATNLVFGLHGFDEERLIQRVEAARMAGPDPRFRRPHPVKVFLAPARHQWREGFASWRKGNDLIIRAVAELQRDFPQQFEVIFVDWGQEVDLSRRLIDELGVARHIRWIPPMPKADLLRAYASVDCVIDQFVLPCIGSVTFEAIAVGTAPVITLLDDAAMQEHYGETIPLFNCGTPDEIYRAMCTVIRNPSRAAERARASHEWFCKRHSRERLGECLVDAFQRCATLETEAARAAV